MTSRSRIHLLTVLAERLESDHFDKAAVKTLRDAAKRYAESRADGANYDVPEETKRIERQRTAMPATAMTADQIALARHALGLPNKRRRSYRNHFVAGIAHPDFDAWRGMAMRGNAHRSKGGEISGGDDVFWLTKAGATAALYPGESLDPEDFP